MPTSLSTPHRYMSKVSDNNELSEYAKAKPRVLVRSDDFSVLCLLGWLRVGRDGSKAFDFQQLARELVSFMKLFGFYCLLYLVCIPFTITPMARWDLLLRGCEMVLFRGLWWT